jgi:hypothetical protein
MKKFNKFVLFALLAGVLVLSACGVARSGLIGQWFQTDSMTGSTMFFEFKENGKLRISYDLDYQFVDDSTIILKGGEGQGDTTMVWKVQDGKLSLIAEGSEAMILDKVK